MTDNMRIWNALAKTDPKHTKPVAFGSRKFTSIDAHWQIQRMTEQFGPVGEGWGYEAQHSIEHCGDLSLAVCDVLIWWRGEPRVMAHATFTQGAITADRYTYGPIRGTAELYTTGKRLDDDAPKKCLTDALTKGLSHLGVSADVFLGLYDDNKYVAKMKQEFAETPARAQDMAQEPDVVAGTANWAQDQKRALGLMSTEEAIQGWVKTNDKNLKKLYRDNEPLWASLRQAKDEALDRVRAPV